MSIFRNKILIKIIAALCVVLTIINISIPNKVYAEEEVWGGILITPITKLLTSIADGVMSIMQQAALEQEVTIVEISGNVTWWDKYGHTILTTVIVVLAVVISAALIFASAGGAAPWIAGGLMALKAGAKIVTISVLTAVAAGTIHTITVELYDGTPAELLAESLGDWWFNNESLYMPAFVLTPGEIFSNQIALLDINFFNPNTYYTTEPKTETTNFYVIHGTGDSVNNAPSYKKIEETITRETYDDPSGYEGDKFNIFDMMDLLNGIYEGLYAAEDDAKYERTIPLGFFIEGDSAIFGIYNVGTTKISNYIVEQINSELGTNVIPTTDLDGAYYDQGYDHADDMENWTVRYFQTSYNYTEENSGYYTNTLSIFYSTTEMFEVKLTIEEDANNILGIIEITRVAGITEDSIVEPGFEVVEDESTAKQLSETISKWYFILRNLALLVLMLILIYTGIRIVIGSTAGEKAKYKERLQDWLVAICLVFIMQYIMIFAIELVEKITELVVTIGGGEEITEIVPLKENHIKNMEAMEDGTSVETNSKEYLALQTFGSVVKDSEGNTCLAWITNMLGRMRIMSQTTAEGTARWVGYSLCYIVLVIETLFFLWTYLKRVLYMAFLTIIAPLVAMTYPIDKMTDGKAQAFDAWLKEYIFNLLIQPLHLLLYTILITAAFDLAMFNPLYAIVAVGFMTPAEQLMRKFFGFTKAQTPGALGGAAGAALAFTGMQKIMNLGKHKGGSSKDDKSGKDNSKIRFSKSGGPDAKKTVADKMQGKGTGGSKGTGAGAGAGASGTGKSAEGTGKVRTKNPGQQGGQSPKAAVDTKTGKASQTNSKKGSVKGALGAAGKRYSRMIGNKMANRIKKMRPIRALARGATGLAGAAAFGMAGLALGIASGDASKAFQYTTAGATGGFAAGKGVAGTVTDALSVDKNKVKDEMEMSYWGEDYKQFKFDESVKNMSEDEGNIDTVRHLTGLSYEESQEMLQTVGRSCYESGITSMEDISAVYEMEQQGYSRDEAIAALKFNQYLPSDLNKMGEEDRNDHINRWTREYEEAGYENPEVLAQESMKLAETINKIKSGLKKA